MPTPSDSKHALQSIGKLLNLHYAPGNLLQRIERAIADLGKTPANITPEDLAPTDEFHVGGREATEHLLAELPISANSLLLDVGCGLGGSARFVAQRFGCQVTGLDLTEEFVAVGSTLCKWTGLSEQVTLKQGNALLDLPTTANFDGAYMIHVGMNISDKNALCQAVADAIKPGGFFAVFDLMRIGDGDINFPVPWSAAAETSFVAAPKTYLDAMKEAGFSVQAIHSRHEYALEFYARMQKMQANSGPQPMGLHLLMGESTQVRLTNAYNAVIAGAIAPVEIVAFKPS